MGVVSGIVVYMLIWWTSLFTVLPWGNKPTETPIVGNAPSAPANPRIRMKFVATTILSAILWLGVYALIKSNVINFQDISDQMMREDGFK